MKLKAQITSQVMEACDYCLGWHKNKEDKKYYEGVRDALRWVLGSRNNDDYLMPPYDYRYLPNEHEIDEYTIFVNKGFRHSAEEEKNICEAMAAADYERFEALIKEYEFSYFALGGRFNERAVVNADTFGNASHCVFVSGV